MKTGRLSSVIYRCPRPLRLWREVDYHKQDDGDSERYRRYRQVPVYPFKPGRVFV